MSSGVQTCALDRKSTRLNSSHGSISYAVFCLKKKAPLGPSTAPPRGPCPTRPIPPLRSHGASAAPTTRPGCPRTPVRISISRFLFFFNDTATTEIYTLSLHDALPIYGLFHRLSFLGGGPDAVRDARVSD